MSLVVLLSYCVTKAPGRLTSPSPTVPAPTPSEHAAAVLNLVDDGVIEWNDQEVVRALRGALKHDLRTPNRQQRSGSPLKPHEIAPSARLTRSERMQITRIVTGSFKPSGLFPPALQK